MSRPPIAREVAVTAAGLGALTTAVIATGRWVVPHVAGLDDTVSRWFLRRRSPRLDRVSRRWTAATDTSTAVAITTGAVLALRWRLRRWHEPLLVLACMAGELTIFMVSAAAVGRARPTIPHLDDDPPTSSFPSGHTSAAVALYGCLAHLVGHPDLRPATTHPGANRVIDAVVAGLQAGWWVIPVLVGTSRVYRGMHHPSDVLVGAAASGAWTGLVLRGGSRVERS